MATIKTILKSVLCVGCCAFMLAGCSSNTPSVPTVHFAQDEYATKLKASGGDTMPKVYAVTIALMKFDPDTITVKKGDTVVFYNHDMVTHDITEEHSKAWTSKPLPADASWKLVATQSSDYYCTIHPVMKGKIVVQ